MEIYLVGVEFPVGTDIEETASGVIGTGTEGVSVGEELNGVDIGFVTSKCLDSLTGTNIPEFGESIASTRDEDVLVGGVDADGHDIAKVVCEFGDLGAGFDIPQHTGHVTGRGQNAAIVDETTAGQVTGVARKLARDTGRALTRGKVVNGANVVETTASNIVPTGSVGAGHNP